MTGITKLPQTLRWENNSLYLINQTKLPGELVEEQQKSIEQVWDSIKKLKVRGAPAIGIAAAYGLLYGIKDKLDLSKSDFFNELKKSAEYLNTSRPTAVNLSWALNRMINKAVSVSNLSVKQIYDELVKEAIEIHNEDRRLCRQIGENGKNLIKEGFGVLTHCNAGSLATSELGTATAPMYLAHSENIKFKVYADETRPLLQGARLTSWELQQAGLDVTLICDDMAAALMSKGLINLVITGADRVAANGDVANKIGTLSVAISAKYFNIPFYVACPFSTIDMSTLSGDDIVIEERGENEVTHFGLKRTAPENIKVRNPAFDVTPCELISGIITEKGILTHPLKENLKKMYS